MGWICHKCSTYNDDADSSCLVCGMGKDESILKQKEAKALEKVKPPKPKTEEKPKIVEKPKIADKPKVVDKPKVYEPEDDSSIKPFLITVGILAFIFIITCIILRDNWKVLQYIVAIVSTIVTSIALVGISFFLEDEFYDEHYFYGQIGSLILTAINGLLFIFIGLDYSVIALFIGFECLIAAIVYGIIAYIDYDIIWMSLISIALNIAIIICGFVL